MLLYHSVPIIAFTRGDHVGLEDNVMLEAFVRITNGVVCPDPIVFFCNTAVDPNLPDPATAGEQLTIVIMNMINYLSQVLYTFKQHAWIIMFPWMAVTLENKQ